MRTRPAKSSQADQADLAQTLPSKRQVIAKAEALVRRLQLKGPREGILLLAFKALADGASNTWFIPVSF